MSELRIHYLSRHKVGLEVIESARCGNPLRRNWTIDPAKVTCGNCKRLMGREVK